MYPDYYTIIVYPMIRPRTPRTIGNEGRVVRNLTRRLDRILWYTAGFQ